MANQSETHSETEKHGVGYIKPAVLGVLLVILGFSVYKLGTAVPAMEAEPTPEQTETVTITLQPRQEQSSISPTPQANTAPTPTPVQIPLFEPYATEETEPEKFLYNEAIQVDGVTLDAEETYATEETIDFLYGDSYSKLDGIVTFRGNNFRDGGSYGYANLSEYEFGESWNVDTGTLSYNGTTWTGSGWVGQPLIVKWPRTTKATMNLYDWAKEDDELVEVIYATMDGNVYFLDLQTGKKTRDTLSLGFSFKGSGALDPRGYPLLYLGAGYDSAKGVSRVFIVSLLDFEVLYTFGNSDSFSLRSVSYFDGSPLVDAETDQLIYPGENGILYIVKLNAKYDDIAGSITLDPTMVKWRYYGRRTTIYQYWLGFEDSPVIWRGHLIIADNGGHLMCIDLNTLEVDWVQDILDDSNGTPVLSMEDGHPYIYVGTSFHLGWRSYNTANTPLFKVDAETGEIIWKKDYICYTESGISGGIQSTVALGKGRLEGYVYVTVAKTDAYNHGLIQCLDRETGEVVWEQQSFYTWSSPVIVYNSDGTGYVVYCTYGSKMFLLDGFTGDIYDDFNLGGGVEASPAVYENVIVVGTRKCKIWGVKLK